jgi:hypothetical protein
MARVRQLTVEGFCSCNGIKVPAGFGRHATGRYAIVRTDCVPPKLVATTWLTTADVIHFIERFLVPELGKGLSRSIRIFDFLDGRELSYASNRLEVVTRIQINPPFVIGQGDWVAKLHNWTQQLGSEFWSEFKPASKQELARIEDQISRKLDPEFREFYRTIGYGYFRSRDGNIGGGIYSPDDMIAGLACPIYFITGSMTQGDEWASLKEQEELWRTRGETNPNPEKFTEEVLTLDGIKLYDLLQIGSNGGCGYHQLYVGPEPVPLRYCVLYPEGMEDRAMSFSAGLERIIAFYLNDEEF